MEDAALLGTVLQTAGVACTLDPDGTPASIRVLYSAPYFSLDLESGRHGNTQPELIARTGDVALVVPESTVLRVQGADYVAERLERVEGAGDQWRRLPLRKAP